MKDLEGRHIVITGANTGIGRSTAEALGARGARLILACRSAEKTLSVVEAIKAKGNDKVDFVALDLSDLDSVRRCADELLRKKEPLHVLINNAGFGGTRGLTKQGFELAFGVNYLGHFLLTTLLLDKIRDSKPARIVNVSSNGHYHSPRINWEAQRRRTESATTLLEYSTSKLALVLFTRELARRLEGTGPTTYALHPGLIASDGLRHVPWPVRPMIKLFLKSNDEGAKTTVWCATAKELANESGRYYDDCQEVAPSKLAQDDALARELWKWSEEWVKESGSLSRRVS